MEDNVYSTYCVYLLRILRSTCRPEPYGTFDPRSSSGAVSGTRSETIVNRLNLIPIPFCGKLNHLILCLRVQRLGEDEPFLLLSKISKERFILLLDHSDLHRIALSGRRHLVSPGQPMPPTYVVIVNVRMFEIPEIA